MFGRIGCTQKAQHTNVIIAYYVFTALSWKFQDIKGSFWILEYGRMSLTGTFDGYSRMSHHSSQS